MLGGRLQFGKVLTEDGFDFYQHEVGHFFVFRYLLLQHDNLRHYLSHNFLDRTSKLLCEPTELVNFFLLRVIEVFQIVNLLGSDKLELLNLSDEIVALLEHRLSE